MAAAIIRQAAHAMRVIYPTVKINLSRLIFIFFLLFRTILYIHKSVCQYILSFAKTDQISINTLSLTAQQYDILCFSAIGLFIIFLAHMFPNFVTSKLEECKAFLMTLGIDSTHINNEELLLTAFVHKSYAADFRDPIPHNERLEFVGDAILGAIVNISLYQDFPEEPESTLTLYKIALVRAETLAAVAKEIGLDQVIFLGNGELKNDGRNKVTILCDCMEAILGYIYLDLGVETVEKVIKKYIYSKVEMIQKGQVKSNKTLLQEQVQKIHKNIPLYIDEAHEKDGK